MSNEPFAPWPVAEPAPALAGPDYVALVIEWADDSEPAPAPPREPARAWFPSLAAMAAAVAGTIGALVLTRWGVRRLRHA